MNPFSPFLRGLKAALADRALSATLARSLSGTRAKRAQALAAMPVLEALRERAAAVRRVSVARHAELLAAFVAAARRDGFAVTEAATGAEAREAVAALLTARGARRVVKGKSMVSEEIGLNAALAARGIEAAETDLGEWIVQLRGEMPSHITAPALHLDRRQVAATFRALGYRGSDDPAALAGFARERLREAFLSADAGVCGANFALADTGRILLVENEGNGGLVTSAPPLLVVLVGLERIVPTLDDALLLHRLLTANATGQPVNAYTHLLAGRASQERHLVIVDHGRRALLASPFAEAAACIRCGACMVACPVYARLGGHGYGAIYPGPVGIAIAPHLLGSETGEARPPEEMAYLCTLCGRCDEVCPVKVPLSRLVLARRAARRMSLPERLLFALHGRLCERPALYHAAARAGRLALRLLAALGAGTLLARLRIPVPPARAYRDEGQTP